MNYISSRMRANTTKNNALLYIPAVAHTSICSKECVSPFFKSNFMSFESMVVFAFYVFVYMLPGAHQLEAYYDNNLDSHTVRSAFCNFHPNCSLHSSILFIC